MQWPKLKHGHKHRQASVTNKMTAACESASEAAGFASVTTNQETYFINTAIKNINILNKQ